MAKQQQSQTQQTLPSPYFQGLLTDPESGLFPQLSEALETPYTQYKGARVAGMPQDLLDAFQLTREGVGETQPFQERAQQLFGSAEAALGQGGRRAQSLLERGVAQGTGTIEQAISQLQQEVDQGNPLLGEAAGATRQAMQAPSEQDVQRYQDPFQQQVIDTTMDELQRQYDIAQQGRNAQAVQAGAFGGSRHGIMESEAERNLMDQQARTLAQLQSQGYRQALEQARKDQQMDLAGGQQLGNLGAQEFQTQTQGLSQLLSGGQALSNLLMGAGQQQAGLAGQQASGLGDLARQQLGLGSYGREQTRQDVQDLLQIGGLQRQQQQAGLDTAFQEFQRQQQYEDPFRRIGVMADIIGSVPAGSVTTTNMQTQTQDPSQMQQLLGLGATGLGAYLGLG